MYMSLIDLTGKWTIKKDITSLRDSIAEFKGHCDILSGTTSRELNYSEEGVVTTKTTSSTATMNYIFNVKNDRISISLPPKNDKISGIRGRVFLVDLDFTNKKTAATNVFYYDKIKTIVYFEIKSDTHFKIIWTVFKPDHKTIDYFIKSDYHRSECI